MSVYGHYVKATLQINPSATLSDYALYGVLNITNASSFFTNSDTDDATKGRITLTDNNTELPFDMYNFIRTGGSEICQFWCKYPSDIEVGTTVTVHVFSPLASRTSYGVSDTYGQYNAYPTALKEYHPYGGGTERTMYQRALTAGGGISEGGVTGPHGGPATLYVRANSQSFDRSTDPPFSTGRPASMMCLYIATNTGSMGLMSVADRSATDVYEILGAYINKLAIFDRNSTQLITQASTSHTGSWEFGYGNFSTDTLRRVASNAGTAVENTTSLTGSTVLDATTLGCFGDSSPSNFFDGSLAHAMFFDADISDSYRFFTRLLLVDNINSWGTWTAGESIDPGTGQLPLFSGFNGGFPDLTGGLV